MKITKLINQLRQLEQEGKTHLTLLGNSLNGEDPEFDIHFNNLEIWNDGEETATLFMSIITESNEK